MTNLGSPSMPNLPRTATRFETLSPMVRTASELGLHASVGGKAILDSEDTESFELPASGDITRVKGRCNSEPGSRSLDRSEIYAKFRRHLNCTGIHMGVKIPSLLIGFFLLHSQLTTSKGEILIAFSLYKSRIRNRTSLGTSLYTSSHMCQPYSPDATEMPPVILGIISSLLAPENNHNTQQVTDRNPQEGFQ